MAIEITLPALGDGIESGDVLEVLVREGDTIEKDQGIIEIETDKATVEVPSSHAGKVVSVAVKEGDTVQVGQTLVTLETVQATDSAPSEAASPSPAPEPAAAAQSDSDESEQPIPPAETPAEAEAPEPAASEPAEPATSQADVRLEAAPAESHRPAPVPTTPSSGSSVVPAGPAVRRFAREVGVDLHQVRGTGPGGRITREDVLQIVREANRVAREAPPETALPPDQQRDAWGPIQRVKMTKIRRTIAEKMHASWSSVPRVTNFDDADVTELEQIRQAGKLDYAEKGIKLTAMPFVIKAVALALRDHPTLNATLDLEQGQIVYKHYINIGIAVDTERGLVVPCLRHADRLSIPDIARELAELAEKVRSGEFGVDDLRGGTFTISNLGAIGGTYSTPIVNVPEVAILLVGRSRKMPVVRDDQATVRLMMPLSLSYDHRLVDGATAARFLNDVISYLEAPGRLLLAP